MSTHPGVELVDLRDEPDEELLCRIHDGLYMQSFPRLEEREDFETLRDGLWGDDFDELSHSPPGRADVDSLPSAAVRHFLEELYELSDVPPGDVDLALSLAALGAEDTPLEPLVSAE